MDEHATDRGRLTPFEEWDQELLEFQRRAAFDGGDPLHFFRVMACGDTKLIQSWTRFAAHLLTRGRLAPRDRELLILRTVWNCGADYEWVHHGRIARTNGLDTAEVEAIRDGPSGEAWDGRERALLAAADELHADNTISDATWTSLRLHYDDGELLELVMVVGNYHLVSFFVRSFAVPFEPGVG